MIEDWVRQRYIAKEKKQLERLYFSFVDKCRRRNIALVTKLRPNRGGLQCFIAAARNAGYKLGMDARVTDTGQSIYTPSDIEFVYRQRLSHSEYRHKNNKEITVYRSEKLTKGHPLSKYRSVPGFGLTLDIYGWFYFIDKNSVRLKQLYDRLVKGKSIEEIFGSPDNLGQGHGSAKMLFVDGIALATEAACKKLGIPVRRFYRQLAKNGANRRQETLDKLRRIYATPKSKTIFVADEDYAIIERESASRGITMQEWLHELIAPWCYS